MNIAITGASGFIGSKIARTAAEHGHHVIALVRESSNRTHIENVVSKFIVGSHDDEAAAQSLVEDADIVIHNSFDWKALRDGSKDEHIRSNLSGSLNLLELSEGKHFIYISSIAVHHHMHEKWGGSIDTAHPTRPGSPYGACKASIEAHLWAANAKCGQKFSAMRPCAVYGIDPNKERSIGFPIVESIKANKPFTRLGGGKFVHVDDVAAATVACIGNSKAEATAYNLVDCYARWSDWASIAAEELGADIEINRSSPQEPKNNFDTIDVTNDLGIALDRGTEGIRSQIKELING